MPGTRPFRFALLASLSALSLVACKGDGGRLPPLATATIGPAGGTLEVTEGDFEGLMLDVPAGALRRDTEISVFLELSVPLAGFASAGRSFVFEPTGLVFDAPASVRLPFVEPGSPEAFGNLSTASAILRQRLDGEFVELGPLQVETGFRRVPTSDLGARFSVAVATVANPTLPLFFSRGAGFFWEFTSGVRMSMEAIDSSEPNFAMLPSNAVKFVIEAPAPPGTTPESFGLYLTQVSQFSTTVLFHGEFGELGGQSFQQIHDSIPLFSVNQIRQQLREVLFSYDRYEPFGSTDVAAQGVATLRQIVATGDMEITTPAGTFTGLLDADLSFEFDDARGTSTLFPLSWTLVDGATSLEVLGFIFLGPATATVFGATGELQSAMVAGNTLPTTD